MLPMTRGRGSVAERVPSQRTQVPSAQADPTPMLSEQPHSESIAVSTNDAKWLDGSPVVDRIAAHLRERASPTKSWFKAGRIADAIGEAPQAVGPALAAMYRSEQYPFVVGRRSSNDVWIYRVEVDG